MFKRQRQKKYQDLLKLHFLRFEAQALSKLRKDNPFLRELIKSRVTTYRQTLKQKEAIGETLSKAEWKRIVKTTYKMSNWFEVKKPDRPSAWAMYNDFKRKYENDYPDWQGSPQPIRKRVRKDFKPKLEGMKRARDDRKYPKGRYY